MWYTIYKLRIRIVKYLEKGEVVTKKEKVKKIIVAMEEKYGHPKCELNHTTAFELLIAVMLSAQCTDARVNIVTEKMFKIMNTPLEFSETPLSQIEKMIYSTGFYRNKAKNIQLTSKILQEQYNGEVPRGMEELVNLAGVGRKTANVVRGEIFGLADGVTVDTHVKRITNLIGIVKSENPIKIEQELMKIIPKKYWIIFSHYMVLHGRSTCIARRPQCSKCELSECCNFGTNKLKEGRAGK